MFPSHEIIAHRGLWTLPGERNTIAAFKAALSHGHGIETDIRDCGGRLVISHDMTRGEEQTLEAFFALYNEAGSDGTLALNIKSDGLAASLLELIREYQIENYFCFDMSVPDSLHYQRLGLRFFARVSEVEPICSLTSSAAGVWIDAFYSEWYTFRDVIRHLESGQDVCIVSPELHGRPLEALDPVLHETFERLASLNAKSPLNTGRLMICTDVPKHFMVKQCA
ncbi:hypothetical protein AB1K70_08080 [Bremerella sp. JC770]|uniref:hypothetical protein n=1 Tax=Bremerella sp. JC770 TaxID=3232137 RepID=UPI003459F744